MQFNVILYYSDVYKRLKTYIREKVLAGIPKAKVAREFNISRRSLYSYLSE